MIEPWVHGNVGEEGAQEYKQAALGSISFWMMPATLLMTVSFSLIFGISIEEIQSTPHGFPHEALVRAAAGHAYQVLMATSALLALRCINTYSLYNITVCNTPANFVPHIRSAQLEVRNAALATWEMPDWDDAALQRLRAVSWPLRLLEWLGVPDRFLAFYAAVDCLDAALCLGAYLKYGISNAVVLAPLFYVVGQELRLRYTLDFKRPWELMSMNIANDIAASARG